MYDRELLTERFESTLEALKRIPRRFSGIESASAFENNETGQDRLDAICMILIAVGEAIKQIEHNTDGQLLARYTDIDWRGVIGVRNVIAHGYFDIDAEQVFDICQNDIPVLITTIEKIIGDLKSGAV